MTRHLAAILLVAAAVTGCATVSPPQQITAKDGSPALLVECRKSIAECHAGARQACPGGAYLPLGDNRGVRGSGSTLSGTSSVSTRFELTFRCK